MLLPIEQNLYLELLDQKHAQELYALSESSRNYLSQWMPWVDSMQTIEYIENYITGSKQRNKQGLEFAYSIFENNKMVGRIGMYKIDTKNKIGEIGYWISQENEGKGIILKSCNTLIAFGFKDLGLNRIEIKCATGNERSQKIPEILNFNYEGIMCQAEKNRDTFNDLKLYSLNKACWLKT